jgi:integrase
MGKHRGKCEGSIYKRRDGRWAAEITLEGHQRKTLYGKSREEVHEKLLVAQNEKRQGLLRTGPQQTVRDFLTYWLEVHSAKLKVSTQAMYKRQLEKHIIPALGHIQLQKLSIDHVQAFLLKKQKEGLKTSTVRLLHTILRAALQDAVRWKRLSINVSLAVTLPRLVQYEMQPLNRTQAQRLLQAAKGNRLECILILALGTGMRLGEILALRWSEVDMEKGTVQVCHTVDYVQGFGRVESEPKTESSKRSLTLPHFVFDALKLHRITQLQERMRAGARWNDQGLVFANNRGGYFSRPILYSRFKKLLREADLPDLRFHDLRHSAATIFLSMGVSAKVVQQILGHSAIGTTLNIYGHVLPEMQRDAMEKMNDFFGS